MKKRILSLLPLALVLAAVLCAPAFALTESEVEAQVAASGKAAVTGNVLIWFLCAVAFLKVSQKIDSFLATLGVNTGRTGGSLMAEAMIAARGVSMLVKAGGGAVSGIGRSSGGPSGGTSPSSSGSTGGFFKGGLIGMAGRHITNSAVKTATTQTSAVHTAQKQAATTASHTANTIHSNGSTNSATHTASAAHTASNASMGGTDSTIHTTEHTGGADTTIHSAEYVGGEDTTVHSAEHSSSEAQSGGAVFARSLASGGRFANDVIGTVARGDIRSTGSITGDLAAQSLSSYMGHTALGAGAQNIPRYSDVEIGGGRITGTEYQTGAKEGMAFGMYHAAQYTAPEGPHQKVYSADGTLWYRQYAQDAVERRPYKAPDGSVAYEERIVKKLPTPPKRKDKI